MDKTRVIVGIVVGMFVVFPLVFAVLANELKDETTWTIRKRRVWTVPFATTWVTSLIVASTGVRHCSQLLRLTSLLDEVMQPATYDNVTIPTNCSWHFGQQQQSVTEYDLEIADSNLYHVLIMDFPPPPETTVVDFYKQTLHLHARWLVVIPVVSACYVGLVIVVLLCLKHFCCRQNKNLDPAAFNSYKRIQEFCSRHPAIGVTTNNQDAEEQTQTFAGGGEG